MKILIVEDDAGISDFVISELEHEGYTTSLAVNGREALVKFENEKPDQHTADPALKVERAMRIELTT